MTVPNYTTKQKINEMKTDGVPVLFVEQKPPKLFAEIELKERGEEVDAGGSYRCPTFKPPKVEYPTDQIIISTSSSNRDDVRDGSTATNEASNAIKSNTPVYPSPFTPVVPLVASEVGGNTDFVDTSGHNDKEKQGNDEKFSGNFKKTSEGKIVVKDASGNEIHF